MIKIYLDANAMQYKKEIESILEDRRLYDSDFDGAEFGIFPNSYVTVSHCPERGNWAMQSLYNEVKDMIEICEERNVA